MRRRLKVDTSTTIHDFSFLMKCVMVFFLTIIITLINPPKKEESGPLMGDIVVDAAWPDGDIDVDLWVQAPRDKGPVGYSRRGDVQSSYLRDDVGIRNDSSGRNFEISSMRGVAPGRYVCNLHLYSLHDNPGPVTVRVIASLTPQGRGRQEIASVDVVLPENGVEKTAFSFELDQDGQLVPGTVSFEFVPIRNVQSYGGN